jgi:hypothetical protein
MKTSKQTWQEHRCFRLKGTIVCTIKLLEYYLSLGYLTVTENREINKALEYLDKILNNFDKNTKTLRKMEDK